MKIIILITFYIILVICGQMFCEAMVIKQTSTSCCPVVELFWGSWFVSVVSHVCERVLQLWFALSLIDFFTRYKTDYQNC
ncbi:hypothetical protein NC653_018033 [Populus alba x Populus x berolinensis]|uniref:Uncharacterized protein n=1 Tax=Populus alba x Populus x berolinensis TaxID=444605 RepID=A0AAD6QRQ0_9ROSI|nr:hypothetical protein NC653_018033 [Populus alba x Populus x berolinensis]